jgi:hypothetical protein
MEQRHRRRTRAPDRQLDLLDQRPSSAPGATPGWRTLTGLMARLLAEHAGDEAPDRRGRADER